MNTNVVRACYITLMIAAGSVTMSGATYDNEEVRNMLSVTAPYNRHVALLSTLAVEQYTFVKRPSPFFDNVTVMECLIGIPGLEQGFSVFIDDKKRTATVLTDSIEGMRMLFRHRTPKPLLVEDAEVLATLILGWFKPRYGKIHKIDRNRLSKVFVDTLEIYLGTGSTTRTFDSGASFVSTQICGDGRDIVVLSVVLTAERKLDVIEHVRLANILLPTSPHQ